MSDKTSIEWAEASWNPIRGTDGRHTCARISPGCDHCYAATMNRRGLGGTAPLDFGRGETLIDPARLDEKALQQPLHWKRPRRIFVCSMTDLFGSWVPNEWIAQILSIMAQTPRHTYIVLTKRAKRMRDALSTLAHNVTVAHLPMFWPLPNVWVGVTVESDQFTWRANYLRQTPAAMRWISAEPLLSGLPSLDLGGNLCRRCGGTGTMVIVHLRTNYGRCDQCDGTGQTKRIDWLVAGGESGHKARPMHPNWARDLRDRCAAEGVAYFFKQWGAWAPTEIVPGGDLGGDLRRGHTVHLHAPGNAEGSFRQGDVYMSRVGNHRSGRLLDGRTWDEYPAVVTAGAAS